MSKPELKLAFNVSEGAKAVGVSKPTFSKMLSEGVIKHQRYGKRIFVSREAIEAFLNK